MKKEKKTKPILPKEFLDFFEGNGPPPQYGPFVFAACRIAEISKEETVQGNPEQAVEQLSSLARYCIQLIEYFGQEYPEVIESVCKRYQDFPILYRSLPSPHDKLDSKGGRILYSVVEAERLPIGKDWPFKLSTNTASAKRTKKDNSIKATGTEHDQQVYRCAQSGI